MGLLDGVETKRSRVGQIVDRLSTLDRIASFAGLALGLSMLATPLVLYWDFWYFTATRSPWWLDVMNELWALGFILGGALLFLLLLVKEMQRDSE